MTLMTKHLCGTTPKPAATDSHAATTAQRPLSNFNRRSIQSWCTRRAHTQAAGLAGDYCVRRRIAARRSRLNKKQSPRCDLSVWLLASSPSQRSSSLLSPLSLPREIDVQVRKRVPTSVSIPRYALGNGPHPHLNTHHTHQSPPIDVDPNPLRILFISPCTTSSRPRSKQPQA